MSDPHKTRIVLLVVLPLAAALVTGLLMNALTAPRIESALEERDAALARIKTLESEIASLTARLTAEPGPEEPSSEEPVASDSAAPAEDVDAAEDGRHFCYVNSVVNETGITMITVDFAELLSGDEAAAAAAAAGEESPPPNDYWIRNVNPRLRTFPVRVGIRVTLTSTSEGTNPEGYSVLLDQWQDFFVGMSPGMERVRDVPYWIEVRDGTVTAIEEQYLP